MSKTDIWMPLHIGDYLGDTMRLTTLQHGAYMLLLMEYWKNGPLPDSDADLAAIAKMERKAWDRDARDAVRRYFKLHDDGLLHQKRVDFEREKTQNISEKRSKVAKERWGNKPSNSADNSDTTPTNSNANADANAVQGHTHARGTRQPQLQPQQQEEISIPKSKQSSDAEPGRREVFDDFEVFYAAYPLKKGRGQAARAFRTARAKASMDVIMAGLKAYNWPNDPKYCPHPSTWLNGERWADQAAASMQSANDRRIAEIDAELFGPQPPQPPPYDGPTIDGECNHE
jgi:uncharacterized protein YdaU (DUF1376 family)